ncbi:hypothetical protein WUBG_01950 [Wuchereria bancrofti]|uniref:peptidylprolyl isomerase n=1 Tax=Wuchereria bancrofti TaxID=6293 RepID=J9FC45_WUCBA|nr:hypothetical protein WUBG_01950 [Wuchereria bancrofti]
MHCNKLVLIVGATIICFASVFSEDEEKLSWKENDGLEIKIIKPIKPEKCKMKSQPGDIVEQFYKLSDTDGQTIGSNFGKKPYTFTLGKNQVISGMDRAMTGMCIGEKRKVVIPAHLGFGDDGRDRDNIRGGQTLYYTIQLVDLFRPVPGDSWTDEDGLKIEVTHKIDEKECRKAEKGDTIHQHYTLHLEHFDGTFVDSSFSRNAPFIFKLGKGEVIEGMDRAMSGMCEGERRKVVIPWKLVCDAIIKEIELFNKKRLLTGYVDSIAARIDIPSAEIWRCFNSLMQLHNYVRNNKLAESSLKDILSRNSFDDEFIKAVIDFMDTEQSCKPTIVNAISKYPPFRSLHCRLQITRHKSDGFQVAKIEKFSNFFESNISDTHQKN